MRQECRECSSVREQERVLHKSDQKSATSKRPTTITTASSKTTATAKKFFFIFIFSPQNLQLLCHFELYVRRTAR